VSFPVTIKPLTLKMPAAVLKNTLWCVVPCLHCCVASVEVFALVVESQSQCTYMYWVYKSRTCSNFLNSNYHMENMYVLTCHSNCTFPGDLWLVGCFFNFLPQLVLKEKLRGLLSLVSEGFRVLPGPPTTNSVVTEGMCSSGYFTTNKL